MRTHMLKRSVSLLLLAAMLVSMFGSSFAMAAELPEESVSQESALTDDVLPEEDGTDGETDTELSEEDTQQQLPEEDVLPEPPAEDESSSEEEVPVEDDLTDEEISSEEEITEDESAEGELTEDTLTDEELTDEELTDEELADEELIEELTPEQQAEQEQMILLDQELMYALARCADESYSYELELANFPDSYKPYLEALHEDHPNWIFVAVDTGLTWDEAINGELGAASTIDYTFHHLLLNNRGSYYNSSSYSSTGGYKPIDSAHVSCSRAALGYYMDPRNFLTDKYIFQFEDQSYSTVQQLSGVQKILKNANSTANGLYHKTTYVNTSGNTVSLASLNSAFGSDYSTIIYNAGVASEVSPYYLASKIAQETGAVTTNGSISGTYSGYTGYYNFYNIGAYASANGGAVAKGLAYAKSKGWSNPILAIKGGADFLASSYIGKGQNTGYYMRFNVAPDAYYSTFSHQYMSATYAVASEAISTYNGYNSAGAVDSGFLFYIPVYDGMPDQTSTVKLTPSTTGKTVKTDYLYSTPNNSTTSIVKVPSGTTVTVLGGSVTKSSNYTSRLVYPYYYQVRVTVSGTSYTGYMTEQTVDLNTNYHLKPGATQSLSSVRTTSGKTGTIYYETSDPDVATVSDSGVIIAKGSGSCKIYAISTGGSFDAVGVKVSSSGSSGSNSGLAAPSLESLSIVSGGLKLTWSEISNADGYSIWRKAGSATGWTRIDTVDSGSTTSYIDTNVESGVAYVYTVRALSGDFSSSYDTIGISTLYLAPPVLKSATASSRGITISWEEVDGAAYYTIWRKSGSSGWKRLDSTPMDGSTSYTDTLNLTSGTSYTYTVRAAFTNLLSHYNSTGISATASTSTKTAVTQSAARLDFTYRVGPGLSYASGGTFSAGTTLMVVDDWSQSADGYTWRKVVSGSSIYYMNEGYLLGTPVLGSASNASGGIKITWSSVTGATGYVVYRKTSASDDWSKLTTISSGSTLSYTDKTATTSGTTYYYTVSASYGSAVGGYNEKGVSTMYLATPALKSAANAVNGVLFSWTAVDGAEGYTVWRKVNSGSWTKIATLDSGNASSYTDTNVTSGTNYQYTVRAIADGLLSGYRSPGVSVNYMATPSIKSYTNKTEGIQVTWEKITGATGYTFWRKDSSSGSWKKLATISSGSTVSYLDTTATVSGNTYYYTVRSTSASAQSSYHKAGSPALRLTTPSLSSAVSSSSGVTVNWEKVAGAEGYTVWRKLSGGSWSKIATLTSGSTTSYLDNTAASGTTYYYTVRAQGSDTQSYYDGKGIAVGISGSGSSGNSGSSGESGNTGSTQETSEYVVRQSIHYRTGPTTSASSMGLLSAKTVVHVVNGWSKSADGLTWVKIIKDGNTYYVAKNYLLETPTLKSVSNTNDGLKVSWNKVSTAKGYVLYR